MTDIVQHISISDFLQKVEEQKQTALQAPVYVFGSTASNDAIRPVLDQIASVFDNQNLFNYNDVNDVDRVLADAIHRIMVFYFYKSNSAYQLKWLNESLKNSIEETLTADLYAVDVQIDNKEDIDRLNKTGVSKFPCVLVYKMGHRVYTNFLEENEDSEFGREVNRHFDEMRNSVALNNSGTEIDTDRERNEFEQRYRERLARERERENQDKIAHLIRVRQKLEEDKKERKRKQK